MPYLHLISLVAALSFFTACASSFTGSVEASTTSNYKLSRIHHVNGLTPSFTRANSSAKLFQPVGYADQKLTARTSDEVALFLSKLGNTTVSYRNKLDLLNRLVKSNNAATEDDVSLDEYNDVQYSEGAVYEPEIEPEQEESAEIDFYVLLNRFGEARIATEPSQLDGMGKFKLLECEAGQCYENQWLNFMGNGIAETGGIISNMIKDGEYIGFEVVEPDYICRESASIATVADVLISGSFNRALEDYSSNNRNYGAGTSSHDGTFRSYQGNSCSAPDSNSNSERSIVVQIMGDSFNLVSTDSTIERYDGDENRTMVTLTLTGTISNFQGFLRLAPVSGVYQNTWLDEFKNVQNESTPIDAETLTNYISEIPVFAYLSNDAVLPISQEMFYEIMEGMRERLFAQSQ